MSWSDGAAGAAAGDGKWRPYEMAAFAGASAAEQKAPPESGGDPGPDPGGGAFMPLNRRSPRRTAEQQAAAIVQEARKKADAIEQDAYNRGFEQGEKDGFEYGQQKAAKVVGKIERLVLDLGRIRQAMIHQGEKQLLDIVFAVSRKVVRAQIDIDTEAVGKAVMDAVGLAADKSRLTVRIHPDDHQYVAGIEPEIFKRFEDVGQVRIAQDPSVSRGGCRVETSCGSVDATVETQLEKIRAALESVYRQEMQQG